MADDQLYDRIVEYYDWEHQDYLDDLQMYLEYAGVRGGSVLDAGCGTGRLLLPIGRAGHRVTGLDSSAAMLRVASARIDEESLSDRADVVQGDLRDFDLGRLYGLAFVALGSFHHLLTQGDQMKALRRLARHVEPRGLLILDLINPSPEWLSAADDVMVHQLTAPFPYTDSQDLVSKFVVRSSGFDTQTDRQLLLYDRVLPDGTATRSVQRMELRYLFRYEAEVLISSAGFRVRDLFGSYDMEPYGASSSRMIFVAEKR